MCCYHVGKVNFYICSFSTILTLNDIQLPPLELITCFTYNMIFDKQLKVYESTGVFKRSYRRYIVNNEHLYVCIEGVFPANYHYASHFIHYIYEYTTDSGLVAMVMLWTSISTSTKNQQAGSYIYSDTKVTLKCI